MSAKTKTALLIIDMQDFFLPMTKTVLPNVIKLSQHFAKQGWPQFFTQHCHPPSDFQPPITSQLVLKWGFKGSLHISTPDWEFIPAITKLIASAPLPKKTYPVIPKNTYDAFIGTDLEERLKAQEVERVVIVGVMTDCCCDTTGRGAFNRGFETWMVKDATGSLSLSQHERGLKAWGFGYGDVISTEEVLERLG